MNKKVEFRTEHDKSGEFQIPADAYWGIQTARSNLSISGLAPHPRLVDAMLQIKKAAALVNGESGRLSPAVSKAIAQAADEALAGQWRDEFIIDPFVAGAGVALNANVNEVLANRAAQMLGGTPGAQSLVNPTEHVNLSQSANDVFPTAMRLAILATGKTLDPALLDLERLLRRKSLEFDKVLKTGRVDLRDSLPVTLGQEFNAYGASIEHSYRRIAEAAHDLTELNMGATVVGTGFNTEAGFAGKVSDRLSLATGFKLRPAEDHFRLSQSLADFVRYSSSLKGLAVELIKIAADLRLMSSGPRAGLGEIDLPGVTLDSIDNSLKTIPLLAESLHMVALQIIANDTAVTLAAQSGQLELNAMTPVVAHNILSSMDLLRNILMSFNKGCIAFVTANASRCSQLLEASGALAPILAAYVGADKARSLLDECAATGRPVRELLLDEQLMTAEQVDKALHYKTLTQPGVPGPAPPSGT